MRRSAADPRVPGAIADSVVDSDRIEQGQVKVMKGGIEREADTRRGVGLAQSTRARQRTRGIPVAAERSMEGVSARWRRDRHCCRGADVTVAGIPWNGKRRDAGICRRRGSRRRVRSTDKGRRECKQQDAHDGGHGYGASRHHLSQISRFPHCNTRQFLFSFSFLRYCAFLLYATTSLLSCFA